jgi:hypothetical protein
MSLRFHFELLRFHFGVISKSLRFHFDVTLGSLRFDFDVTLISLRSHFGFTSMSLRCHFDFTSISLRFHFDVTSISLLLHFAITSISLPFHFDLTSISQGKKGKRSPQKGKGKSWRGKKGKGKSPSPHLSSISTWQPDLAHARTKRNDSPVGLPPQPPIICVWFPTCSLSYFKIRGICLTALLLHFVQIHSHLFPRSADPPEVKNHKYCFVCLYNVLGGVDGAQHSEFLMSTTGNAFFTKWHRVAPNFQK